MQREFPPLYIEEEIGLRFSVKVFSFRFVLWKRKRLFLRDHIYLAAQKEITSDSGDSVIEGRPW